MRKKLLFFCSVTQIGGAETNILKISKELHDRGFEIHFATLENNGPMFKACESYSTSQRVIGRFGSNPIAAYKKYKQLLQLYEVDAVFNFGLRVEVFSRIVTRWVSPKTKIIANIRSTNNYRKWYEVLLDRITSPLVDTWVSNSEAGKQAFVRREKIAASKIHVVYNYIEPFRVEGERESTTQNVIKIGVLANIKKLKGHFDLIPLSKMLSEKNIPHQFICAGVDNTQGRFERELKQGNLEANFDLWGYTSDKLAFFKSIDVFLLPSYLEGMPTSILEAMSYGRPVLSTSIDGIPEQIVHMKNGLIYAPGDIESFANGIELLYKNPTLGLKFINESKSVLAVKFDKQINIQKWIDVIG